MPVIAVADPTFVPVGVLQAPADVGAIIEVISGLDPGCDVVLVSQDRAGMLAARSARLARGEERIGLLAHAAPATSFFLTATALRCVPEDALNLVGLAATLIEERTVTQVLLSSVSRLVSPGPRFADHVRSLWPASRFVIDWNAASVGAARTLAPVAGHLVVVARSAKGWDDVDETGWPAAHIELAASQGPALWSSLRWLETTTLQVGLEIIAATVSDQATIRDLPWCRSCGRAGWAGNCVFCQLPLGDERAGAPDLNAMSTVGGHE